MKTWSDGVLESWSIGSIPLKAALQYSGTPIPRRRFRFYVLTLCAVVFALCLKAEAQQPKKVYRIGYLSARAPVAESSRSEAIRLALRQLGYIEGQNIVIDYRYAKGEFDRLPELAADLVRLNVHVIIISGGDPDIRAARLATKTIPIVMTGPVPILLRQASLTVFPVPVATSPA